MFRTSFLMTVALLAATTVVTGLTSRRIPQPLVLPLETIGTSILGWQKSEDLPLTPGVLARLDPTSYLSRNYKKENREMSLFIAFYAQQRAGESMHSPKHCLPGAGWEIWKHGSAMVLVGGKQVEINQYSIENSGTRMLMFYWYQSRNRIISSEYIAKVMLARDTLLTGRTGGSIVRILLRDLPGAPEEGVALATDLIPRVQRCFGDPDNSL